MANKILVIRIQSMNPLTIIQRLKSSGFEVLWPNVPGIDTMKKNAVFIFSQEQLNTLFSDTHPFNQKRILLTLDLLKSLKRINDE